MNTNLSERLHEAMADSGVTPKELALACNVRVQAVYQWQSGATKEIKGDNLLNAATKLGVRPEWLSKGTGHKARDPADLVPEYAKVKVYEVREPRPVDGWGAAGDDVVWIERYDVKLSAGNGNADWVIRPKDPISFRAGWFRKKGLHPDNCRAMYVRGDSMERALSDGDTILIDITDTEIIDGEIYAASYRNKLYIKTLERTSDGIRLKSENPEFSNVDVPESDAAQLHVLGRKVWRGG